MSSRSKPLWLAAILVVAGYILLTVPTLNKGELDLDESGTFLVATRPDSLPSDGYVDLLFTRIVPRAVE